MRGASSFTSSVLSRTLATVHDRGAAAALQPRSLRVALFCSSRTNNSYTRLRWFSPVLTSFSRSSARAVSLGLAGAVASVATAASVYAKEPPPAEIMPKDVVLYQYEACPFCNKVKGSLPLWILFFVLSLHSFQFKFCGTKTITLKLVVVDLVLAHLPLEAWSKKQKGENLFGYQLIFLND